MDIKVDKWEKLDYDKLLNGIAAVVYIHNERDRNCIVDLRDRETKCNNNYPWYKGAFGNCIISLSHARTTDKLYLINEKTLRCLMWSRTRTPKEFFETEAVHIITRKEV